MGLVYLFSFPITKSTKCRCIYIYICIYIPVPWMLWDKLRDFRTLKSSFQWQRCFFSEWNQGSKLPENGDDIWVFRPPNRGGKNLQIIHFNRVFHYFHHPFWGTTIFGNTHIETYVNAQNIYLMVFMVRFCVLSHVHIAGTASHSLWKGTKWLSVKLSWNMLARWSSMYMGVHTFLIFFESIYWLAFQNTSSEKYLYRVLKFARNLRNLSKTFFCFQSDQGLQMPASPKRHVMSPCPVTVTTRIVIFLIGNPYKPSFATVTGRGDNPRFTY